VMDEKTLRELFGWRPPGGSPNYRKIGVGGTDFLQIVISVGAFVAHACVPLSGRPDMSRPYGYRTFLDCLRARLKQYVQEHGTDEGFELSDHDREEIRWEILDFYRRRRFLLEAVTAASEFDAVVRDGMHALELMDMLERYYPDPEAARDHRKYEPYIRFHMTQARALMHIECEDYKAMTHALSQGIGAIRVFDQSHKPWEYSDLDESLYPEKLMGNLKRMGCELLHEAQNLAVKEEHYENAAVIRDLLAELEES